MTGEDVAKIAVISLAVAMVAVLGIGFVLVVRDTLRREGKFGVSAVASACPECGNEAPIVRTPANRRQALWGGWTCDNCFCEIDKWGKRLNCPECGAEVPRMARPRDFEDGGGVEWTCPECEHEMFVFLPCGASPRRRARRG